MIEVNHMNAIPESVPVAIGHFEAQAEIEDFANEFLKRFECESEKSFCDTFEDKARAKAVFVFYLEVSEETLAMLGWGGRSRPYPTKQDIRDLIRRQRNFRTELNELVKTARIVGNT